VRGERSLTFEALLESACLAPRPDEFQQKWPKIYPKHDHSDLVRAKILVKANFVGLQLIKSNL
jgi:hypothetical protein